MNETAYTPGPWVINDEDPADLKVECAAYEDETPGVCASHSKEWPLTIDDARLISTAPSMAAKIETLRSALLRLRGRLIAVCQDNDLMTDEDAEAIAQADRAL
jgi:hypothetical protein